MPTTFADVLEPACEIWRQAAAPSLLMAAANRVRPSTVASLWTPIWVGVWRPRGCTNACSTMIRPQPAAARRRWYSTMLGVTNPSGPAWPDHIGGITMRFLSVRPCTERGDRRSGMMTRYGRSGAWVVLGTVGSRQQAVGSVSRVICRRLPADCGQNCLLSTAY